MGGVPILENVLPILREFKRQRGDDYQLIALGVYGSVARGEATDDSDVNIVFSAARTAADVEPRLQRELERRLERRVGLLRLRRELEPRFRERIVRGARFV